MMKSNHRKRGMVIVYASIFMVALMAVVSLAVDWGRVQTAKTELQDAADAAARYAVTGISGGTYLVLAQAAAGQNTVDGTALTLLPGDVELGTWNNTTRTFDVGGSSPDSVRVTGRRAAARSNGVPLVFARAIGRTTCDIAAVSVATMPTSPASPNIIGLNSVAFGGVGKIKRIGTEAGTVNVATNGTCVLTWGQQIIGDALYRAAAPVMPMYSTCITGTSKKMSMDLVYATPSTPGGCFGLGTASYGNGQTYVVPAGNYSASSLTLGGGATINLTGNVNIYCSGPVDIGNGCTVNTNNGAYVMTVYQTAASTITLNVGTIYLRIYAPLSNVSVTGATQMNGSIVCKNLLITDSGIVSYSSALPSPVSPSGSPTSVNGVSTVK